MGIAQWAGVLDTVGGLVQIARRFRQGTSETLSNASPFPGAAGGLGQIEARLAGVVVAALKEAFDRDSARKKRCAPSSVVRRRIACSRSCASWR
jgi:hypothetical protein